MSRAARLQYIKTAVTLPVELNIAQEKPCVHQGRDADLRLLERIAARRRQARKHSRDLPGFQEINEPRKHRFDFELVSFADQGRNRVENQDLRLKVSDHFVNNREVHLETVNGG